jgi:hypothetical protein
MDTQVSSIWLNKGCRYGDEKGASEMIFSYGFLERDVVDARQLFLDLDIPDDDPLKPAKKAVCNAAPGFRLFTPSGSSTDWESPFVWWACINEEDGLEFRVLQLNDGGRELKAAWKGNDVESSEQLQDMLKKDSLWHVFLLRAVVTLQERVSSQLCQLQASEGYVQGWFERSGNPRIRVSVRDMATKLRNLEMNHLGKGFRDLEAKVRIAKGKRK